MASVYQGLQCCNPSSERKQFLPGTAIPSKSRNYRSSGSLRAGGPGGRSRAGTILLSAPESHRQEVSAAAPPYLVAGGQPASQASVLTAKGQRGVANSARLRCREKNEAGSSAPSPSHSRALPSQAVEGHAPAAASQGAQGRAHRLHTDRWCEGPTASAGREPWVSLLDRDARGGKSSPEATMLTGGRRAGKTAWPRSVQGPHDPPPACSPTSNLQHVLQGAAQSCPEPYHESTHAPATSPHPACPQRRHHALWTSGPAHSSSARETRLHPSPSSFLVPFGSQLRCPIAGTCSEPRSPRPPLPLPARTRNFPKGVLPLSPSPWHAWSLCRCLERHASNNNTQRRKDQG